MIFKRSVCSTFPKSGCKVMAFFEFHQFETIITQWDRNNGFLSSIDHSKRTTTKTSQLFKDIDLNGMCSWNLLAAKFSVQTTKTLTQTICCEEIDSNAFTINWSWYMLWMYKQRNKTLEIIAYTIRKGFWNSAQDELS